MLVDSRAVLASPLAGQLWGSLTTSRLGSTKSYKSEKEDQSEARLSRGNPQMMTCDSHYWKGGKYFDLIP